MGVACGYWWVGGDVGATGIVGQASETMAPPTIVGVASISAESDDITVLGVVSESSWRIRTNISGFSAP